MFQIEKVSGFVSGFELSVLYSYAMRSAFVFVSGLKCGKRWHPDPISSVPDPNPSLISLLQPTCFSLPGWSLAPCHEQRQRFRQARPGRKAVLSFWLITIYRGHRALVLARHARYFDRWATPSSAIKRGALSLYIVFFLLLFSKLPFARSLSIKR